jgi:hypothetical protein
MVSCPETYLPSPLKEKAIFNRSEENLIPYGIHGPNHARHIDVQNGQCSDDSYNFFNIEETR